MSESILVSTKKILGIEADYTAFDMDIIMHVNSAIATLNQLGIGPEEGFMIEDDSAEWGELLDDDPNLNNVKSFIYLTVKLAFDPPTTSFALAAFEKQIAEHVWRINVYREGRDRV